jgi:hypothetical protein
MSVKAKYGILLNNPDVARWYSNVARGSRVTADVYLRRLGNFCQKFNARPKDLVSMSEKELYDLLLDLVSSMENRYAGSYVKSVVKAVKSWLAHNGIEVKRKIKIRGVQDTPSLRDERVPTQKELKKIFLSGDKKARVASVLIAHSGLRIKTIGNYQGNEGLRLRDFPELITSKKTVDFEHVPSVLVVRRELSKAGHQYLSFLSEEGSEYLKDYLEERIREGEQLTPESPVVTPKIRVKPFIRATNVGDVIRGEIRKAGFKWRPYVLRSYFDTQLMLAESKGLVLRDYRQFWMGHKGDVENKYTTNKQKLPETVIEDMREAYRRSQEFLQTIVSETASEEKMKEAFKKQLLLVAGFKEEEVEKTDFSNMSDEEFQSLVRQKLAGIMQKNGNNQKVISLVDVEKFISEGWEFVATLPNKKAIVKTPF